MAFYDEERILEEADSYTVASFIGMETKRVSGNRIQIKCPGHLERLGHEDRNFGSAYLTPKGYRCFACNKTIPLPNMVMEVEGCDYKEALAIIADSLGGRELFITSGKKDETCERERILSENDLALIGLKSSVSYDFVHNSCAYKSEAEEEIEKREEAYESLLLSTFKIDASDEVKIKEYKHLIQKYSENSDEFFVEFENVDKKTLKKLKELSTKLVVKCDYSPKETEKDAYLLVAHQTESLKSLFIEDPEYYYFLINSKAKEYMDKYKNILDDFKKKDSFFVDFLSLVIQSDDKQSLIYDISQCISSFYMRAKEIYLETLPEVEEEVQPVKPKIRLDLFD